MKTKTASVGALLLIVTPLAFGGSAHDRTDGPCFEVNIQNDRENHSSVEQKCDWNFSRTVQAGTENWAQTSQTGSRNDNKVRQYQYDRDAYFNRMRGN